MLSKTDIRNLIEVFATKEDLKEFVTITLFKETMDSVIVKLDAIYGELQNLSEEKLVNSEFRRETKEEIADIKHRIAAKS